MKKQKGFTLPELIISFVLGMIIIAATLSMYVSAAVSSADTVQSARLNHDLETIMTLMVNDIKRAGFWGGAHSGTDAVNNLFTDATTNIQILSGEDCIRYSYDENADGEVDDEYYGFALDDGRVRASGNIDTVTSLCPTSGWETLNEESTVEITALNFDDGDFKCLNMTSDPPVSWSTPCSDVDAAEISTNDRMIEQRVINITLTGRLIDDTAVSRTLQETVKVRNNRVYLAP